MDADQAALRRKTSAFSGWTGTPIASWSVTLTQSKGFRLNSNPIVIISAALLAISPSAESDEGVSIDVVVDEDGEML